MPTYRGYYSASNYGKLWFDADSADHAEELILDVQMGNLNFDDLPNLETKPEGNDLEIDGLKEISK